MRRKATLICVLLGLVAAFIPHAAAYPRPGRIQRVDLPPEGLRSQPCATQHGCMSWNPVVSSNGRRVAFASNLPNLVPGDTNGEMDVFVRDMRSGRIVRVSVGNDGRQATPGPLGPPTGGLSVDPSISADGRYVSFTSYANDLVPGDGDNHSDIFVRDLRNQSTVRVSVGPGGRAPSYPEDPRLGSFTSSISENGRYVAFATNATNLGGVDCDDDEVVDPLQNPSGFLFGACGFTPIYRHDRKKRTTVLVSVSDAGLPVGGRSASISGNGRYVAFESDDSATSDDTEVPHTVEVYRRDVAKGETVRVSTPPDGRPTYPQDFPENNTGSKLVQRSARAISANGRYVVFNSTASNLVPSDSNALTLVLVNLLGDDVFVKDMKTGRIERVSVSSTGDQGQAFQRPSGYTAAISATGRYVVFAGPVDTFTTPPTGFVIHDRLTGATLPGALSDEGEPGESSVGMPSVSSDGSHVASRSSADNFPDGDVENPPCAGCDHIFLYDRGAAVGADVQFKVDGLSSSQQRMLASYGVVSRGDQDGDVPAGAGAVGADLTAVRLAHRSQLNDIYIRLDVTEMPQLAAVGFRGSYAVRFTSGERVFEVRSVPGPSVPTGDAFQLFECSSEAPMLDAVECRPATSVSGAIGTIGSSVTLGIPLEEVGLGRGGHIRDVHAVTSLAGQVIDEITL